MDIESFINKEPMSYMVSVRCTRINHLGCAYYQSKIQKEFKKHYYFMFAANNGWVGHLECGLLFCSLLMLV